MPFLSRLASLRRNLFARPRVERDLDDELRAYLDQLTDEKRAAGMGAAEARRAARIELGGMEQVKEEVRQVRTGQMLEELLQDLRYGIRTLRKNPAFTRGRRAGAGPGHRRQHCHVQRGLWHPVAAAALCRRRSRGGGLHALLPARFRVRHDVHARLPDVEGEQSRV